VDFAFDIDAKRPTKKGKLVAMAPWMVLFMKPSRLLSMAGAVHHNRGEAGRFLRAFVTNAESRKLRIRPDDMGTKYLFPGYRLVFDSIEASLLLRHSVKTLQLTTS